MPDITPEVLSKISEILERYGIKAELMEKPQDDTYKPWESEEDCWEVNRIGGITGACNICLSQSNFFNAFRTEETARHAAATDKINHCVWQWKEKNDAALPSKGNFYGIDFFILPEFEWITCCGASLFEVFTSKEKTSQFIKECRPYLDEYAKDMGWK